MGQASAPGNAVEERSGSGGEVQKNDERGDWIGALRPRDICWGRLHLRLRPRFCGPDCQGRIAGIRENSRNSWKPVHFRSFLGTANCSDSCVLR